MGGILLTDKKTHQDLGGFFDRITAEDYVTENILDSRKTSMVNTIFVEETNSEVPMLFGWELGWLTSSNHGPNHFSA